MSTALARSLRRYGFDALIVLAAIEGALEVALRQRLAGRARRRRRGSPCPATALIVLPLLARRRFPFAAPAAVWLLAAALSFVDGRLVPFTASASVAGMAAAFLLGNLRDDVQARIGLGRRARRRGDRRLQRPRATPTGELVFIPLLFAIGWLAGFALRERAEQAEAAEERAAQAEREREAAARIAVAEERARIARELHDIVAHAVSVMVLQVGAVRHKLPDDARRGPGGAPAASSRPGRTALAEMRRLLGAMRRDGDDVELAPQPGPRRPRRRCSRRSAAPACPCGCTSTASRVPLPRAIDLSAYRIVQEGLTNALKHARASHADVTVRYGAGRAARSRCATTASAPPASDGLGHGLVGVRERVKIYGGEMTAGAATGRRLRPQHAPPARRRPAMSDPRPRRRRPVDGPRRLPHAARRRGGHRGRRRGEQRARGGRQGGALRPDRRPDGHPHARARRARGDAAHPRRRRRRARILILTTFDLDEYVYEALRAGASGFVLKDDPPEQLIAAIRTVAAGDALLSPAVTKRVIRQFARIPRPAPPRRARRADRARAATSSA